MLIKRRKSMFTLECSEDEVYEILQALESHKRKLGRLASRCVLSDRPATVQVYNSVEQMIAKLSADANLTRKSKAYSINR